MNGFEREKERGTEVEDNRSQHGQSFWCSNFRACMGPHGEEVDRGTEEEWLLGESGRRNREGGDLCRLRHRAVFSGGRLQQLQCYYKAGLLGFMNKARK